MENGQRKTLLSEDLILDFISKLDSVKLSFEGEQVSPWPSCKVRQVLWIFKNAIRFS